MEQLLFTDNCNIKQTKVKFNTALRCTILFYKLQILGKVYFDYLTFETFIPAIRRIESFPQLLIYLVDRKQQITLCFSET